MSFQMVMTQLLRGISWKNALCYIDDILVYSKDFVGHLQHLQDVFDRLRKANLKLKPSKCRFAVQWSEIPGNMWSTKVVWKSTKIRFELLQAILARKCSRLEIILGINKLITDDLWRATSNISQPLYKLFKKDIKFQWSDECENAFQKLKTCMVTTPVLIYPNMHKPFILSCDASGEAISYILSQKDCETGNIQ